MFDGLGMGLGNLHRLSDAKTRSICAENPTGEKGRGGMATEGLGAESARDLGQSWKVAPAVHVPAGETFELADIDGPGAIQHIWLTLKGNWRFLILRFYWDGEETPSVEAPAGDFFCTGWGEYAHLNSLPVCVNPGSAFNCYWEMPFRKHARVTIENMNDEEVTIFYQIDYTLTGVLEDRAYFHAQWRRSNPVPYKEVHTIVDGVQGRGHYVGTYVAHGVNNREWWGEGEVKFYLDGDAWPTICGTGEEDYFCGSYGYEPTWMAFDFHGHYKEFSTACAGLHQVIRPDGAYRSQTRFGQYRWHLMDPIRFEQDLKVTIQSLGWRSGGRYLPQQDDVASVAYWYQTEPHAPFPKLPERDELEVI